MKVGSGVEGESLGSASVLSLTTRLTGASCSGHSTCIKGVPLVQDTELTVWGTGFALLQ